METIGNEDTKRVGRPTENPLKLLFEDLKARQKKLDKIADQSAEVKIKVEHLNNLLIECLKIEGYLAKKPLTISEIYIWAKNIIQAIPIITLRDTKEMWKYVKDNGKYVPNADTYIQSLCTNEETGSARASTQNVLRTLILNIQGDTYKDREEFKPPINMVNLNNGVYCKADGKLYPHSHEYKFTYKLPFDYEPLADCPTFRGVVNNLFPDIEDRIVIQRWFGYHFLSGYPYQKYLHLCGPSGAGKTALLHGLYVLLGEENYTAFQLQDFLDRNTYAVASLFKKLANICPDMSAASVKDMSIMKRLVSTKDRISTRNLYGSPFQLVNEAKITFASNKMPFVTNKILLDDAIIRRAMIFKVSKADFEVNERIYEQIELEASGIFNWSMIGFSDLIENNGFGYNKDPMTIWVENMENPDDNVLNISDFYGNKDKDKISGDKYDGRHVF